MTVTETTEQWRAGIEEVAASNLAHVLTLAKRAEPAPPDLILLQQLAIRTGATWRRGATPEVPVSRGDLLTVVNLATTVVGRTVMEEAGLEGLAAALDGAFSLLGARARETWGAVLHECECGAVTTRYWCSDACQREYDLGDGAA